MSNTQNQFSTCWYFRLCFWVLRQEIRNLLGLATEYTDTRQLGDAELHQVVISELTPSHPSPRSFIQPAYFGYGETSPSTKHCSCPHSDDWVMT